MNTLLRALVIVITVLGATALVFAVLNFDRRQILLGRNAALVELVKNVAATTEAQDAPEGTPRSAMLDIAEVTDRVSDNVDKKDVFDGYLAHLESANLTKLKFEQEKEDQLYRYYAQNEDGTIRKTDRGPVTNGPGTMQELLDQLLTRAKAQNATLDKTRSVLSKQSDLVAQLVEDINKLKRDGRVVKQDLTGARAEIVELKDEKATLERNVAKLQSEKKDLQAEVLDLKNEVETAQDLKEKAEQDVASKVLIIADQQKRIQELLGRGPGPTDGPRTDVVLPAGDKGMVVATNDEYKYAILELSSETMDAMLGETREKQLPQLEMNIRREGRESASGDFVTKIRLRNYVKDKNFVVADILTDWQQSPVEKGDVVWY